MSIAFPQTTGGKVKNVNVNVNINKSEDDFPQGPPLLARLPQVLSTLQPQLKEASPEVAKLAGDLSNAIAGLNK